MFCGGFGGLGSVNQSTGQGLSLYCVIKKRAHRNVPLLFFSKLSFDTFRSQQLAQQSFAKGITSRVAGMLGTMQTAHLCLDILYRVPCNYFKNFPHPLMARISMVRGYCSAAYRRSIVRDDARGD
jgi:hypothetical protein